jgi:hypothetical protein
VCACVCVCVSQVKAVRYETLAKRNVDTEIIACTHPSESRPHIAQINIDISESHNHTDTVRLYDPCETKRPHDELQHTRTDGGIVCHVSIQRIWRMCVVSLHELVQHLCETTIDGIR